MQMKLILSLLTLIFLIAISACDSNPTNNSNSEKPDGNENLELAGEQNPSCTAQERNVWINDEMHDTYLWYQFTPDLDAESYSDPQTLLQDLRYTKYDRFSFLMEERDYINAQQGISTAFGFKLGQYNQQYLFRFISPNSPMAAVGINRGDELIAVGGIKMSEITNEQWNMLTDSSNGPHTQQFLVSDRATSTESIHEVTSGEFTESTVFRTEIKNIGGIKTAYLGFSRFLRTSVSELTNAFKDFKQQSVQELVLDLRYNPGGLIFVSNQLGGLIGGMATKDQNYTTLKHNDRYSKNNFTYKFTETEESLDLQRVIVLTTARTCSASEMLINGLKPFLDVVVIGARSCGKPIGMYPKIKCDKALFAINFEARNALDEGEYFDGINPTCAVDDFPRYDTWDKQDTLHQAALDYITSGSCSSEAQSSARVITQKAVISSVTKSLDPGQF